MNSILKGIATSVLGDQWPKYSMWILGVAVVVGQPEMNLSDVQVQWVASITIAALLAQGLADFGKGALLATEPIKDVEATPDGDLSV